MLFMFCLWRGVTDELVKLRVPNGFTFINVRITQLLMALISFYFVVFTYGPFEFFYIKPVHAKTRLGKIDVENTENMRTRNPISNF